MLKRALTLTALLLAVAVPNANADLALSSTTVVAQPGVAAPLTATASSAASAPTVTDVTLVADPVAPAGADWIAIGGPAGPFTTPFSVSFTITVTVPASTPDGDYLFNVYDRFNGVVDGEKSLQVKVGAGGAPAQLRVPKLATRWSESRLIGGVTLGGSSTSDARLTVTVQRRGGKVVAKRVFTVAPGKFSRVIRLMSTTQPGKYIALETLTPTVSGLQRTVRSWLIDIPPPPEGYVNKAWISGLARGPASLGLPTGTQALFASFHFIDLPHGGPITTTWYQPDGSQTPSVSKPRAVLVQGFVKGAAPLVSGRWRCVLRVNGVAVSETSVLVG